MSREVINDLHTKLTLMGKLHAAHASVNNPSEPVPSASSAIRYSASVPAVRTATSPPAGSFPKALSAFADMMANWQTNVDANASMVLPDDLWNTVFHQAYQDVGPARLLSDAWDKYKTSVMKMNENAVSTTDKAAVLLLLNNALGRVHSSTFPDTINALLATASPLHKFQEAVTLVRGVNTYDSRDHGTRTRTLEQAVWAVTNFTIPDPDPRLLTWDTFLSSSDNQSGVDPKLGTRMGLKYLYSTASAKLAKYLRDAAAAINKVRQDLSPTRDKAPLAKELQKVVTALTTLVGKILDMQSGASFEANSKDLVQLLFAIITTYSDALPDVRSNRGTSNWSQNKGMTTTGDDLTNWVSGKGADGVTRHEEAASRSGYHLTTTQDGKAPGYVSEGILYRAPDINRMRGYLEAAKGFLATVGGDDAFLTSLGRLGTMAMASVREVNAESDKLSQAKNGEVLMEVKRRAWSEHKAVIMRSYARGVHNLVGRFVRVHAEFAVHHNRAALRYMEYWRSLAAPIEHIKLYYEALAHIVKSAADKLHDAAGLVKDIFNDADVSAGVMDVHAAKIQESFTDLSAYITNASGRIRSMMTGTGPTLLDLLTDPQAIAVYALKIVRGVTALLAATIASHAFRAIYAQRVYEQQTDPPSPFLLLLILAGVELGITLVVAGIVFAVARITASSPDTPINTALVSVWLADVAMTTAIIYAISAVLAAVIQRKKYFRYYQEGDRGVRALTSLVLWTYMIVLLLPMFRLAG